MRRALNCIQQIEMFGCGYLERLCALRYAWRAEMFLVIIVCWAHEHMRAALTLAQIVQQADVDKVKPRFYHAMCFF